MDTLHFSLFYQNLSKFFLKNLKNHGLANNSEQRFSNETQGFQFQGIREQILKYS